MVGHLGLQSRLDDAAGQLRQQADRTPQLLGLQAPHGVVERPFGQQARQAVNDRL